MKAIPFICTILIAASAQAAELPVLSRHSSSGFVAPSARRTTSCDIYDNRIELTESIGNVMSARTIHHGLSGNVEALIEEAKAGPFRTGEGIPDTGIVVYEANLENGDRVPLKSSGTRSLINASPAAAELEAFIDLVCGRL